MTACFPSSSAHSGFACGSEPPQTSLIAFPLFLTSVAGLCFLEEIKLGVSKLSMIRRSPSRNHRSKGIKVKHSHDKKKEFDENDAKVSDGTQTLKLGRKDLHPGKDKVNQNEKHEEEEDENIVEDEDKHEHNEHESEEKEDDKHGARKGGDEQEEDEKESDEVEDERGGGDDKIDENDTEESTVDTDHDEELIDEEEEKENSKDEENDGSVENHNSHEAREEHYKGDDASSAVSHDTATTSTETETHSLENSDVNSELSITKSENRPNNTEEGNRNQHSSNFNIKEAELSGRTSSNATSGKETGSNSLSNAVDSSHLDNITMTYSDSHSEAGSNLTIMIPGGSHNLTGISANTSSEQNKMVIFSESNQAQNGTVNTTVTKDVKNVQTKGLEQGGNRASEENLPGSNSTVPIETENGDAAAGESSNLQGGELEKTTKFVASNETENKGNVEMSETNKTQNISHTKENADATKDELKGDKQTDETSETSSATGTSDTDSSASHILKNVAEVRTDLDTLPDIRNEGDNNGDVTATE
ncbi:hypothetical protein CR513_02459, partial [Mucuna pruriens]